MIPIGVLFFSLLVGLVGKYLHAANVIHGGVAEKLGTDVRPSYATFPGTLLSSFFSLLSGASVGPEGALAFLVVDICSWVSVKLKMAEKTTLEFALAGLAAAYNGIVGSLLFSALFASEMTSWISATGSG